MYTSFTNNLHRHFLRFLLGNLYVLGEIPNNDYEKFGGGGGGGGGGGERGVLWELCK